MPEPNCDCPYCPLTAANVQTCDVLVVLKPNDRSEVYCPKELNPLAEHFNTLMLYCRNNCKQKIGTSLDLSKPNDYECNVNRLNRDTFKICFHALNKETDPVAPFCDMD
jgi:hypothetical protein